MAKAKKTAEVIEAESVKEEVLEKAVEEKKDDSVERFICRKLMAINNMPDRAKARRLAERVLMNNRKG